MKKLIFILLPLILFFVPVYAQDTTGHPYQDKTPLEPKAKWYKSKIVKATILPVLMIGYGVSTIHDNGIYSSYNVKADIQKHFGGFHYPLDDYLILAPYVELLALNLAQIGSKNDFINTSLLILKSELFMGVIVFGLKQVTNIQRPDSSDFLSFPSGHTAEAFLAASIVHNEFRHKSEWYGVAAYSLATTVGIFRMLNNKHWQSDVIAGAGIGILSSHLAYLSHRNRWGRKSVMLPIYREKTPGIYYSYSF